MSRGGPLSERALILTPTGRDAALASAMLNEGGFAAKICAEIPTLVAATAWVTGSDFSAPAFTNCWSARTIAT